MITKDYIVYDDLIKVGGHRFK